METKEVKRLDHINVPLPAEEVDDIFTQLDDISTQLENPDMAGKRAIHSAEKWGWHKYLRLLGRAPDLTAAEQGRSTEVLVNYFCAIRVSGGINQYSPRALREYFLNEHLSGTLLTTVAESAARRTGITLQSSEQARV